MTHDKILGSETRVLCVVVNQSKKILCSQSLNEQLEMMFFNIMFCEQHFYAGQP